LHFADCITGNRFGQKADERRLTTGAQIANLPYKVQSEKYAALWRNRLSHLY
jgi:hypothetical protein